ncbi:MAG: hypothetical protein DWH91_11985 [Planctomycetota bacterium]|nr:MAG: hypothetical protein DWH91_11985 [Planctomycetota bacterium]
MPVGIQNSPTISPPARLPRARQTKMSMFSLSVAVCSRGRVGYTFSNSWRVIVFVAVCSRGRVGYTL